MKRFCILAALAIASLATGCGSATGGGGSGTGITIRLTPATSNLATKKTRQLDVTVTGSTDTRVEFTVQQGTTGGTVSSTGLYTAPATAGTFTIVAKSLADPTKIASASIVVTAPPKYKVDLVPPVAGGITSEAVAINGTSIIGFSQLVTGNRRAFLLKGTTQTELGVLSGDTTSEPTALNSKGQIVGFSSGGSSLDQTAFLWQSNTMTRLSNLPASVSSVATGINDAGQVVGFTTDNVGRTRAFIWKAGVTTQINPLTGDVSSRATAINTSGQVIVISTSTLGVQRGFIWKDGAVINIPPISGASDVRPQGINDAGAVVGLSGGQAFLFEAGKTTSMGALTTAGGSNATSISTGGTAVGSTPDAKAVVFTKLVNLLDLNELIPATSGWALGEANGVDVTGKIVGTGTFGSVRRGFVLTITP